MILGHRLVLGGGLLGHQQDALAGFHGDFQGLDRLGTADEQGDDHVGEDNHVAQRQQRQGLTVSTGEMGIWPDIMVSFGYESPRRHWGGRRGFKARIAAARAAFQPGGGNLGGTRYLGLLGVHQQGLGTGF